MLYTIVAVLVLVLDQAVKFYTVRNIPPQAIGDACKTLIPGVVHMTNVQNYGAAFSILENNQTLLIVVSAVFIVGIIILISMDIIHTKFGRWTAVLVMAGALGNCIDRILLGYVVDMFEFEMFTFAVFNVADIFITVCGILFCVHVIVYREPEEERNAVPHPEKTLGRLFASRREPDEEEPDEEDEEEDIPAPRRLAGSTGRRKAGRAGRPRPDEEEEEEPSAAPRHDRRVHRTLPEADLTPQDPSDPFAEWEGAGSAKDAPAPRRTRETPAPKAPEAPVDAAPAENDAAPARPAPQEADDAGFDEYSLDDILAEFRDS